VPAESVEEQWDIPGLETALAAEMQVQLGLTQLLEAEPNLNDEDLLARAIAGANAAYQKKLEEAPRDAVHQYERFVMLSTLDTHWREHLSALDHLRQGIHLRGYAQKNPKQEYKRESFELFGELLELIKLNVTKMLMAVQIRSQEEVEQAEKELAPQVENVRYQHAAFDESAVAAEEGGIAVDEEEQAKGVPLKRAMGKVGRNDPCPCGSGKKYKQCHGKLS
jgi:preprotein translocase subunit SecA